MLCKLNSYDVNTLCDTGSQVTTLSADFYEKHFSNIPLQDLAGLLTITSVSGEVLPYRGYFVGEIAIPVSDNRTFSRPIPIIVVPNTKFNHQVPLLIGTNFLKYLLSCDVTPVSDHLKLATQTLDLQQRHLNKSGGVYGHLHAASNMMIQPFSALGGIANTTISIPIHQQIALMEGVGQFDVVPGLVCVSQGQNSIPFEIVNNSSNALEIKAGQFLGQLHQATVQLQEMFSESKEFLDAFDMSHLPDSDRIELSKFLVENRDVFAMSIKEMGTTDVIEHQIELTDPTPFKEKLRPIPPSMYEEVRNHISELLSAGVIKESKSPFSSVPVLVRKKDNSLRLCIDYRKLNSHTKRDNYTIPRVEPLIDSLKGAKFFASLDMICGYHQIKVAEEDQEKTAFVTPVGFYEHVKLPFGLSNSPSTFQRMIDRVLEGLVGNICVVYLDDILCFGKTKTELYKNLQTVFDRMKNANLRLKPKKCKFLCDKINFLGHTVSAEGVQCSEEHIRDVKDWKVPLSHKELQQFLGFANFYRRYVPGFAAVAEPLTKLFRGHKNVKKFKTKGLTKSKGKDTSPTPWKWEEEQQAAFDMLKKYLTEPPILAYPDFKKPFCLHTDASKKGLGAVLYQRDEQNKLRVISYGSRTLNNAERNYSAHKLEFLALKWAVTQKFQYYLFSSKFDIFTDHNPLVYLTSTAKLDAQGHRWVAELANYNFTIHYKPGLKNVDADSLSRYPHPEIEQREYKNQVDSEVFKEICRVISDNEFEGVAESVGVCSMQVTSNATTVGDPPVDWYSEQRKDQVLNRVINIVSSTSQLSESQRKKEHPQVRKYLSYFKQLVLNDGVLYKKSVDSLKNEVLRLVVPSQLRDKVLELSHDTIGHPGQERTLSLAQSRYFWVGLPKDIGSKIKGCRRCTCAKAPYLPQRSPLVSIVTSRPMELLCMDFLGLEEAKGKFLYVLVVTDHFTKMSWAFPTRNQEAKTVAKILVDHFMTNGWGIPERLHSDQGASFEGKVISHLCETLGIKKSRITPYSPQGNGQCERFNRTLLSMLKTLSVNEKANWKDHASAMAHAYNCMVHESTGFTPYFLMFGRCPRLPLDIYLGREELWNLNSTAQGVRDVLKSAYKVASEVAKKARASQAKSFDKKVRGSRLEVGDLVLVRNVGLKGKCKLADRWKDEIFIVEAQPSAGIPVYKVRSEDTGLLKILHRNNLLPLTLPWPDAKEAVSAESRDVTDEDEVEIVVEVDRTSQAVPHSDELLTDHDIVKVSNGLDSDSVNDENGRADTNIDIDSDLSVTDDEQVSPQQSPVRRYPQRLRKPVQRYGIGAQNAQVTESLWQKKVALLLELLNVFPSGHFEILNTILCVIYNQA